MASWRDSSPNLHKIADTVNLLGFLLAKELATFVFNPLQTNQFRKSLTLSKTKTDKVDARTIASQFHSLVNLLESTSKGRIDKDKAKEIRNLARKSVGVYVSVKVLELSHTIKLIQILNEEIAEIEERIQNHMQEIDLPIESISGISFRLAAVIQAEIGDFFFAG